MRRMFHHLTGLAREVEDRRLLGRYALDVGLQGGELVGVLRRGKQQQGDEGVFVVVIGADTFFEDAATRVPECAIRRGIVFLHSGEVVNDAADEPGADLRDMAGLLQPLAGDVEGQVSRVHDAFRKRRYLGIRSAQYSMIMTRWA